MGTLRTAGVIARREVRLLAQDPVPLVLLLVVPVVFLAFLKPMLWVSLIIEGYPGTNGAEQAVPGAAATFSLFLSGLVGLSFFREHGWGMWDRLRASSASTAGILLGKVVPLYVFAVVQVAWLFAVGVVFFDLDLRGSAGAVGFLTLGVAASHLALGLLLVALAGTIQQVNALANLGSSLIAGLGGAIVPIYLMPHWVRTIAPATPTYWVMRGYRAVTLDGRGLSAVAGPTAVLAGFAVVLGVAALLRFKAGEAKRFWT